MSGSPGEAGAAAARQRPWFLYLHTLEPHAPYAPPPDLRQRFAPEAPPQAGSRPWLEEIYRSRGARRRDFIRPLPALYAAEVAAADRAFGAFRAALERRGQWDGTLVVFVADHGESLGERGFVGHGQALYGEELDIPLLIKLPGQRAGRVVETAAQHLDLLPTLLAAAGVAAPAGVEGDDLFATPPPGIRPVVSHLDHRGRVGFAVTWDGWRWIEPLSPRMGAAAELYDLRADPGETRNLATAEPVIAGWMRTLLRVERLAGAARGERAEMDEETRRALSALGYL